MRFLVLWADDRATNLGVQALGAGTRALLESIYPDSIVHEQSYGTRHCPRPMGSVRGAGRELLLGGGVVVDWLREYDLVVDTRAGDSFADIYGNRRLLVMNLMSEAVRRSGTPLVMGPQTIGPFRTIVGRQFGSRALKQAAAVFARDTHSAQRSAELGRPVDVVATDVVFALPVPDPDTERDVILNVSGLLWQSQGHVDSRKYQQAIVELAAGLSEQGRHITLLPHVLENPTMDSDIRVLEEVNSAIGRIADIAVPASLTDARRILAGGKLTFGSRMHACLNSLSVGVPAIPLAYSAKFAPLFDDLGWRRTVDLRSSRSAAAEALEFARQPGLEDEADAALHEAHLRLDLARTGLRKVIEQSTS